MKYNEIEREEWLASINPNFQRQTFHNEPVLHPCHITYFDFFKVKEIVDEYISPSKICGLEIVQHSGQMIGVWNGLKCYIL